jgi:hypothetical protein
MDDKITVVVLTNLASAKPAPLAERIAEMYISGAMKE